jgi:NAD-dependent dihydropyrimidine dehydrogenase PreA subunit
VGVVNYMKKEFEEGDIKITIDLEKCTGAGECVIACPVEIFEVIDGKAICKNLGECIECCACVTSCPNDAIEHASC